MWTCVAIELIIPDPLLLVARYCMRQVLPWHRPAEILPAVSYPTWPHISRTNQCIMWPSIVPHKSMEYIFCNKNTKYKISENKLITNF